MRVPKQEEVNARWEQLGRRIAERVDSLRDDVLPEGPMTGPKGKLLVLGSGIESVGFTIDVEMYVKAADVVFYLVTDPTTQFWILKLCPEAYDLSALYGDEKPRYNTYMQMTEAMLYHVRQGKTVVSIYYGHPGIFALATHRAIAIARREGHLAIMKPGVSALDCLCADLGVDPSYPGMQTYEATDMLMRGRRPDAAQHVVLWQVGAIGEMGYRRRGYVNQNFIVLIQFLQEIYGNDYPVVNYVAARYPTLPPTIETFRLSELLRPANQTKILSMSTFYLAPKEPTEANVDLGVRIGLFKPGSKPWMFPPARPTDRYGERELQAIRELSGFRVPPDYQAHSSNRAAEFMLELTHNLELQQLYESEPERAVSDENFPGLSAWERRMLASRNEGLIQTAVKGGTVALSPGEQFVVDLFTIEVLPEEVRERIASDGTKRAGEWDVWMAEQGYPTNTAEIALALSRVSATSLLPWTGVYADAGRDVVLTIVGHPQTCADSLVFVNNTRIRKFTFAQTTLSWGQEDGNPNSAVLTLRMPAAEGEFVRQVSGSLWTGEQEERAGSFIGVEIVPNDEPLHAWTARYATEITRDGESWEPGPLVELIASGPTGTPASMHLLIGEEKFEAADCIGRTLYFDLGSITFEREDEGAERLLRFTGTFHTYGTTGINVRGTSLTTNDKAFGGQYVIQVLEAQGWTTKAGLHYRNGRLVIGAQAVDGAVFQDGRLDWSGGGGQMDSGRLHFYIDPATSLPMCRGTVWPSGAVQPASPNLRGRWVPQPLRAFSGRYATRIGDEAGPYLLIRPNEEGNEAEVVWGGRRMKSFTFLNGELRAFGDEESFDITFGYEEKNARSFYGTILQNGVRRTLMSQGVLPTPEAWAGTYGTAIQAKDGTFVPSDTTIKVRATRDELFVELSDGRTTTRLTEAVYNAKFDGIAWVDQTGTPEGNLYANGMIKFDVDPNTGELLFKGKTWKAGEEAPKKANWAGHTSWMPASTPLGTTGVDVSLWRILNRVTLCAGGGLLDGLWQHWRKSREAIICGYRDLAVALEEASAAEMPRL